MVSWVRVEKAGDDIREATNGEIPTSQKIMSQRGMTWSKGAVPPRFGYFVEGQSNAVGRPADPSETLFKTRRSSKKKATEAPAAEAPAATETTETPALIRRHIRAKRNPDDNSHRGFFLPLL